jgi:uncharacterized protein YbjT (DUF2867 family)
MNVFITGGTGYMGCRLIPLLMQRGHKVKTVVRAGSEKKLPVEAVAVVADPLKLDSYTSAIPPADTFVHLIGVPHPSPIKAAQFRDIDLLSIRVAVKAARDAGIRHFIYLSVAQPAPVMKAFLEVRHTGEEMIRASGIPATFVRPWYVLGPGHYWPYPLLPFFWLLQRLPATREAARRLGFVTLDQMLNTIVWTVENPAEAIRIIDVPRIREIGRGRRNKNCL